MSDNENKTFSWRAFVSVSMFLTGIILPVSGIMNHNLQFAEFTSERHFWMAVHNLSALIFSCCTVSHILLNRNALYNHFKRIKEKRIRKEALVALIIVIILVGVYSAHAFRSVR